MTRRIQYTLLGILTVIGLAVLATSTEAQQTIRNITIAAGWATPATGFANPTNAVTTWSLNGCWNGTTWDRCPTGDGGSGAASSNTSRVIAATDSPEVTVLGATGDAAATAGSTGSVSAKLRTLTGAVSGTGFNISQWGGSSASLATFGVGATGAAPPANANYMGGLTSGATGGLQQGVTICDSGGWLNMTTATTTEIAPLVASRTIYICSVVAQAGGTTTMTFQRGTGTNCGTGTTAISPGYELTAQTGWTEGTGIGVVIGPVGSGTVGGGTTASNAVCVTSSAAVNLHVKIRYAVF